MRKRCNIALKLSFKSLYHLTHPHLAHQLVVQVLGHGHGGDDAELVVEVDGTEVAEDVLATLAYLLVDGALLLKAVGRGGRGRGGGGLGDDGEQIGGGGGVAVDYLLHGAIPREGDGRIIVRRVGDVGEEAVSDVSLLQVGDVDEVHAVGIEGDEEQVADESLRFRERQAA